MHLLLQLASFLKEVKEVTTAAFYIQNLVSIFQFDPGFGRNRRTRQKRRQWAGTKGDDQSEPESRVKGIMGTGVFMPLKET